MAQPHIHRVRRLRRRSTFSERKLWDLLRSRAFDDLKFRRQAPIGDYVVDFACLDHRIVVELDGGIHDAPFYDRERQRERDLWLASRGFTVLRFDNSEIELPHTVLERIRGQLSADTPHPVPPGPPSPSRGEGN